MKDWISGRVNKINENCVEIDKPFEKRWCVYLPIMVLEIYIILSYVSYLICPMEWPLRYDIRIAIYMSLVILALLFGYIWAMRKYGKEKVRLISFPIRKYYNVLLIFGAILFVPTSLYRTGKIIPPFVQALLSPGKQYYEKLSLIENRPGIYNLIGCFYVVTYSVVLMTYFYWDKLSKSQKVCGGILSVLYILIELSTGKNIGIATITISICVCYFAKMCGKDGKKSKGKYTVITFATLFCMMFLFSYFLKSRTGYSVENEKAYLENVDMYGVNITDNSSDLVLGNEQKFDSEFKADEETTRKENENLQNDSLEKCPELDRASILLTYKTYSEMEKNEGVKFSHSVDYLFSDYVNNSSLVSDYYRFPDALSYVHVDNKLYTLVPDKMKFIFTMGTIYLSNGYHGLSLALYQPWDSSFGLGHLKTIQYYLVKLFGVGEDIPSFENKLISIGWPVGLRWHTAFAQFASDFSFIGSIIVMFLMGWLLAELWLEVVAGGNPISVTLFGFYCVQFFFITSWWYAGLTGGYFITFYLPLFLWGVQRILLRKKQNS